MLAPPEVPCNASRARNTGRPKEGKLGKRGQSSEEVRVRHQMGKESARPQALLYVVPKANASAIWPFLKNTLRHRIGLPRIEKPGRRSLEGGIRGRPAQQ